MTVTVSGPGIVLCAVATPSVPAALVTAHLDVEGTMMTGPSWYDNFPYFSSLDVKPVFDAPYATGQNVAAGEQVTACTASHSVWGYTGFVQADAVATFVPQSGVPAPAGPVVHCSSLWLVNQPWFSHECNDF